MPRRKTNARKEPQPKKIRIGPQVVIVKPTQADRDVYPGWIVAAAEWREEARR